MIDPLITAALKQQQSPEILLERAASIALNCHAGQRDKQGKPYILHITRVMNSDRLADLIDVTIAALHDVVEDTRNSPVLIVELDMLRQWGFPEEVVEAVELLTRPPYLHYDTYIDHMLNSKNLRAMRVKLADLDDHMGNIHSLNDADRKRLAPRYIAARERIELALRGM